MEGYVFHGGYCVIDTYDGEQCGLMDKKGNIVLPMEYSSIHPSNDFKYWRLQKGEEMAVLDSNLKPILPLSECSIYICAGTMCGPIMASTIDILVDSYDLRSVVARNINMEESYEQDVVVVDTIAAQ